MNYSPPYLEKYKGKSTRHTCPSCKTKQSFTLYMNGNTHEPIHHTVGRCNRESKCGYHYTPKQYFIDNPLATSPLERAGERSTPPLAGGRVGSSSSTSYKNAHTLQTPHAPSPQIIKKSNFFLHLEKVPEGGKRSERAGVRSGEVPLSYLIDSLSPHSNFVSFLKDHFSEEQIQKAFENYLLGATKNKEVIFWQIDINGKIRTGKIMQYNPKTGRRLKHQSGAINWVHNKLKKSGALPEDYNLQQCFFGEHLLKIHPEKFVAIVESEKSATIASIIIPELIWLAAGSLNGLSIEKCQVLKNRKVILLPDSGAFEKWQIKSETLISFKSNTKIVKTEYFNIMVSNLLENIATDITKSIGLDIVDYLLNIGPNG
ncbi:MAG: DUF6371 domain-containing protein [Bacteroidota bacterium]